jgi:micrococcal nuclease
LLLQLLFVCGLFFVLSCFRVIQTQGAMQACSPKTMRFALLTLALATTPVGCAARQQEPARQDDCIVAHVADGDSFRCADGRQVRLIGVDSPESQQRPYGERARNALLQLLRPAAAVRLESDVVPTDRYGRRLAYVWVGPTLVNEAMVLGGWAVLYTVPPNVKYAERLTRAQNEARARGAGLWSQRGFECLPNDFRSKRCVSSP